MLHDKDYAYACVCVFMCLRASSGRALRTHATIATMAKQRLKQKRIMAAFACSFFPSLGAARPQLYVCVCVCECACVSVCMFALLSLIFTLI